MADGVLNNPVHLTSSENKHVKAVLRLGRQRERRRNRLLITEGVRQVTRALEAGLRPRELYWSSPCADTGSPGRHAVARLLCGRAETPRVFTVTPQLMAKMAYRQNPEDVLGVFEQPCWSLGETRRSDPTAHPCESRPLWLVAVGTQKPGNLGSMVRTAEAAGCQGVLVADGVVDVFNPNAICASTGAVFRLPVVSWSSREVMSFLVRHGVYRIAAVPQAKIAYTDVDLTGPVAVVVGAEDVGLPEAWLGVDSGDETAGDQAGAGGSEVSIGLHGQTVDSLNAATAAAVLLFEAVRQRRAAGQLA